MKILYYFGLGLLLTACASTELPYYILVDNDTVQYKGGDSLTYSVLSIETDTESTGRLTQTYLDVDLLTPQKEIFKAISQVSTVQGDINFNFATPNLSQLETGEIILQGFTESAKTYWLANSDSDDIEKTLYPSPIAEMSEPNISGLVNLLVCESNSCQDSGNTSFVITPLNDGDFEKIETEYAKFDAYKFQVSWLVTISNDNQSAGLKTWALTGEQWIYPPLGVVKFTYTLESDNSLGTLLIGTLASTNINIPDENEKK